MLAYLRARRPSFPSLPSHSTCQAGERRPPWSSEPGVGLAGWLAGEGCVSEAEAATASPGSAAKGGAVGRGARLCRGGAASEENPSDGSSQPNEQPAHGAPHPLLPPSLPQGAASRSAPPPRARPLFVVFHFILRSGVWVHCNLPGSFFSHAHSAASQPIGRRLWVEAGECRFLIGRR